MRHCWFQKNCADSTGRFLTSKHFWNQSMHLSNIVIDHKNRIKVYLSVSRMTANLSIKTNTFELRLKRTILRKWFLLWGNSFSVEEIHIWTKTNGFPWIESKFSLCPHWRKQQQKELQIISKVNDEHKIKLKTI